MKQLKIISSLDKLDLKLEDDVLEILLNHLDGADLTKKIPKLLKSKILKKDNHKVLYRYLVFKPESFKKSIIKNFDVAYSSWTSSINNLKLINHLLFNQFKK